jgi:hypothetical protein
MILSLDQNFIFVKTVSTGGSQVELTLAPYLFDNALQTLDTVGGQYPEVRDRYRRVNRLPMREFAAVSLELVRTSPERLVALKGIASSLFTRHRPTTSALAIEKSHMSATELRELVGIEAFQRCFKVSLVRNPYNRIASAFWHSYRTKYGSKTFSKVELQKVFFNWLSEKTDQGIMNQRILTDTNHGDKNKILVDHLIRYENLETSLDIFAEWLKVDVGIMTERFLSLPARNNSRPKNISVTDVYSYDSMELVRQIAAWEFDSYGYDPTTLVDDV